MTGEDLGYKPREVEKAKFKFSPLGEALSNRTNSKTNKINKRDKIVKIENKIKIGLQPTA